MSKRNTTITSLFGQEDCDLQQAKRFLEKLAGSGVPVTFQTYSDKKRKAVNLTRIIHGTLKELAEDLKCLNQDGAAITVSVNETDLQGRKKENIKKVRALFLDLDDAPLEPVREASLPPHLITESSPRRFQCIYLVVDLGLDDFEPFQSALARRFSGDGSVASLERCCRVPGFFHHKGVPFRSRLIEIGDHPPYTSAQLMNFLGNDLSQANKRNESQKKSGRIKEGERHNHFLSRAGAWLRYDVPLDEALEQAKIENERFCDPPLPDSELNDLVKDIYRRYEHSSGEFRLTDQGNAERLVRRHGRDLKYCGELGWIVWDGKRWVKDKTGEIYRRAKETLRSIYEEAARKREKQERKETADFAMRCEHSSRIESMVKLARSESEMIVRPDQLDTASFLFNCLNGTLDLRTGILRPHRREDLITKLASVEYDPAATCPLWESFLQRILGGSGSIISYVQRVLGYALTGDTTEQAFFICHGTGANGKSTFVNAILHVLGDYGEKARAESFLERKTDSLGNDLAGLLGARFVAASEPDTSRRLSESLIKEITGGEPIRVRFLYREFFQAKPQWKIFLNTNHRPAVPDGSEALWRRVNPVPFDVTIPPEEQDKKLEEKLQAEASGILAWIVRGCLEWQLIGLAPPERVTEAVTIYREEADPLGDFFSDERFDFGEHMRIEKRELYEAYVSWCGDKNPMSRIGFSRILSGRFRTVRLGQRKVQYLEGIGRRNSISAAP